MKKLCLLVLIFAFAFACVFAGATVSASAESANDVEILLDEHLDGDELTVIARMDKNDGFVSLSLRVEFDNSGLYLESLTHAKEFQDLEPTDNVQNVQSDKSAALLVLYIGYGENTTATGELFTITFRVKDSAVNGTHKVSLYVTELGYKVAGGDDALNEKYSTEESALDHTLTGGVLVADAEYIITNGVPAPEAAGDRALVIVLAVVGGVLVVGGIFLAAFFAYRKKQDNA